MVNQQSQNLQSIFAKHINFGSLVLGLSLKQITELFKNHQKRVLENLDNRVIEVRLDSTTLTCSLNESNICDSVYLFLDDLNDLEHYTRFCNEAYTYDHAYQVWRTENHLIEIRMENNDFFFVISKHQN